MAVTFALLGSLGFARLLVLSSALTNAQPTISWSPDSRWIAYSVASRTRENLPSDWLFTKNNGLPPNDGRATPSTDDRVETDPPLFQIWATRRDSKESALIEESKAILGPPSWRPDSRAIAFVRFNIRERNGSRLRGAFEVVICEGLDRRKTLYAVDDLEIEDTQLIALTVFPPTWNRDGSGLAVSQPGETEAVLILSTTTGRLVRTIENSCRPAWSPDGNRLAAIREGSPESSGDTLLLVDSPLTLASQPRPIMTQERILQPALWSGDSQSILAVYSRSRANIRSRVSARDIVLGRYTVATGDKNREWPLSSEPLSSRSSIIRPFPGRDATPAATPGSSIPSRPPIPPGRILDYDPETDECFYVTDGLASSIVCYNLRTDITHRRFPPLDLSAGVGTLSVSPDGRTLAIRFKMFDGYSPPAFCDIATETLKIPTADESIRVNWISSLIAMVQAQLRLALPSPTVLGAGVADRPTLLPAPGEITPGHPLAARIQRLSRIGRSLFEPPPAANASPNLQADTSLQSQAGLFFSYLVGDLKSADEYLDQVDSSSLSPLQRRALLGVRAQILMSRGDLGGSLAIINYLTDREAGRIQTLEETPNGFTIKETPNPRRLWGSYLAQRHAETLKAKTQLRLSRPDGEDVRMPGGQDVRGFEERPRNPLLPLDPDARLLVEPPIFVRP